MSRDVTYYAADSYRLGDPPILCTNCGEELMAVGVVTNYGLHAGYEWAHVSDGQTLCRVRSPKARPYDDFDAGRALRRKDES